MKKHLKYLFFIHRISHTKGYNNPLYIKKLENVLILNRKIIQKFCLNRKKLVKPNNTE